MKKIVTGGFVSLVGAIWTSAVILCVGSNLVSGWSTPPGRFLTSMAAVGMTVPLIVSLGVTIAGVLLMAIGCVKKDS